MTIPDALAEVPVVDPNAHIGIYVHVPFCQKHCPYCDFVVVEGMLNTAPAYVDALCAEIRAGAARHAPNPPVATIFLGGGTPSLLRASAIDQILTTIRTEFDVLPDAEVTLEANPGPLRPRHLAGFRSAGISRLSLGVQTFSPLGLAALGRLHTPEEAKEAVANARAAGFDDISLDLIFGWEDQSLADWHADLATATACRPDHISAYALTVEEGTPLAHAVATGATRVADDDLYAEMLLAADERLTAAGFAHYEISNYALPGHRSRHNCGYWANGDYLGFGVGAHSHRHDRRWWNVRDLHVYLERAPTGDAKADSEIIDRQTAMAETMLLGMRLAEGIQDEAYVRRHATTIDASFGHALAEYAVQGLVMRAGGRTALTSRGRLVADGIAERFVVGGS